MAAVEISLDAKLAAELQKLTGEQVIPSAVESALREYLQLKKSDILAEIETQWEEVREEYEASPAPDWQREMLEERGQLAREGKMRYFALEEVMDRLNKRFQ